MDPHATDQLLDNLDSADKTVRDAAGEVLQHLIATAPQEGHQIGMRASCCANKDIRIWGIRILGDYGGELAVSQLAKALEQEDSICIDQDVACEIVGSLEKIGHETVVPVLERALHFGWRHYKSSLAAWYADEGTPWSPPRQRGYIVRMRAAEALGTVKNPVAVKSLGQVLNFDRDSRVRAAAARSLGELGEPSAVGSLWDAISNTSSGSITNVIEIQDEWPEGGSRTEALCYSDATTRRVKEANVEIAMAALDALSMLGDAVAANASPEAADFGLGALAEAHKLRRQCVRQYGLGRGEPPWDFGAPVRGRIVQVVARPGIVGGIPLLLKALMDRDRDVRHRAFEGLMTVGKPAIPSLVAALQEPDIGKRRAIANVLLRLGWQPATDQERIFSDRALPWDELIQKGSGSVPLLLQLIAEGELMEEANISLACIGEPAVESLIAALEDSDNAVRDAAGKALSVMGACAASSLVEVYFSGQPTLKELAMQSLISNGDHAIPALIEVMEDHHNPERPRFAAKVLGMIGSPRAVDALIHRITPDGVRAGGYDAQCAADALVKIGAPAVSALIAAFQCGGNNVKNCTLNALIQIGLPARSSIERLIHDDNIAIRTLVTEALRELDARHLPRVFSDHRRRQDKEGEEMTSERYHRIDQLNVEMERLIKMSQMLLLKKKER